MDLIEPLADNSSNGWKQYYTLQPHGMAVLQYTSVLLLLRCCEGLFMAGFALATLVLVNNVQDCLLYIVTAGLCNETSWNKAATMQGK